MLLDRVRDFDKALSLELASLQMLSILWRACGLRMYRQSIIHASGRSNTLPVNVLPKMSFSGGRRSFGVMVSVMESFEGSSPGRFLIEVSSVCKLYDLRQLGFVSGRNEIDDTPEHREHCSALLRDSLEASMLSRQHRYII